MFFRGTLLLITVLIISTSLFGQIEFQHDPPMNYQTGQPLTITVEISEAVGNVAGVQLFYRKTGGENYQVVDMYPDGNRYTYDIPPEFTTEAGVDYAIVMTKNDGSKHTFPTLNPMENPHEILPRKSEYGAPILLSPDDKSRFPTETKEILIALSLFNITGDITNPSLLINGKEQIGQAEVFPDLITFKYKNFKPGDKELVFSYTTDDGMKHRYEWSFQIGEIKKSDEKKYNYTGNVKVELSTEQIKKEQQNLSNLTTNFRGNYGKTNYKSRIYMTTREDRNKQPVNRFNFDLSNRYIDLKLGDVYPSFSELSLYGNRVRGLESKVNWGFFNLDAVWGHSKRDIRGAVSDTPDTLEAMLQFVRSGYTFQQKVLGIKPSFDFGNHVNFGLYFLKAKDDTASVAREIGSVEITDGIGITMPVKPRESINLGLDLNVNLDRKRTIWQSEIALSETNTNIYGGPLSLKDMDTYFENDSIADDTISISNDSKIAISDIPFDPGRLGWLFTINPHLEPLLPIVPDSDGNIGFEEFWNMPALSVLSKLKLNYFKNYVVIKYKKIGQKYNSLVNPYLQKNFQEFQIEDRIRFYEDRIIAKIGYTNRINNYSMEKSGRYYRNAVNFGFSFFSLSALPNMDYNGYFDIRENHIDGLDTLYISDTDYQLCDSRIRMGAMRHNISMTKEFDWLNKVHVIQLNYSFNNNFDMVDNRLVDYNFSAYKGRIIRLNYRLNVLKRSRINFEIRNNNSDFGEDNADILGISAAFNNYEKRETYWYYGRYDFSSAAGLYDFTNHKLTSGVNYNLYDNHRLNFYAKLSYFQDRLTETNYADYNLNLSWYYYFR
ncbi:MAG: hypothetical protein ACLFQM_07815 [Fidelibacterota bacterium]